MAATAYAFAFEGVGSRALESSMSIDAPRPRAASPTVVPTSAGAVRSPRRSVRAGCGRISCPSGARDNRLRAYPGYARPSRLRIPATERWSALGGLPLGLDHVLTRRPEWIRTDGADQGIQVGGLLHPCQLGLGALQARGGVETVGLVDVVA